MPHWPTCLWTHWTEWRALRNVEVKSVILYMIGFYFKKWKCHTNIKRFFKFENIFYVTKKVYSIYNISFLLSVRSMYEVYKKNNETAYHTGKTAGSLFMWSVWYAQEYEFQFVSVTMLIFVCFFMNQFVCVCVCVSWKSKSSISSKDE